MIYVRWDFPVPMIAHSTSLGNVRVLDTGSVTALTIHYSYSQLGTNTTPYSYSYTAVGASLSINSNNYSGQRSRGKLCGFELCN